MENTNNNLAFVAAEWLEPITNFPADCRNRVILAIVEYQLTGVEPELDDPVAAVAYAYIKPNVDRMAQFRRQQAERRKTASAAKPSKRKPKITEPEPEITAPDQYSKSNSNSNSESKSESKSKTKNTQESGARKAPLAPSVIQINDFCRAKGITNVDPQKFYDYYSLRGWTTAQGNPVRDWQAQLLSWSARESASAPAETKAAPAPATAETETPEQIARREEAEKAERRQRKAEIDYYVANVPGANTPSAVISYPEFCSMGLHECTPEQIADVLGQVRRGLIPRNPIFAKRA